MWFNNFKIFREPAYECIGQSGKVIYYDQLIQLYQDTESSQEKLRILRKGLASFSNKVRDNRIIDSFPRILKNIIIRLKPVLLDREAANLFNIRGKLSMYNTMLYMIFPNMT